MASHAVAAFINVAAGIFAAGIPLMGLFEQGENSEDEHTIVEIIAGNYDPSMGGNVPNIDLFNNQGEWTARWSDREDILVNPGGQWSKSIKHGNDLNPGRWWPPSYEQYASYIALTAKNNNAICISAVLVNDAKIATVIFGDVAQACNAQWGIGNRPVTTTEGSFMPKCFWLDGDGESNVKQRAATFHLPDHTALSGRASQYRENIDMLCGSTPRVAFWRHLKSHSWIPFFKPPLEYETDREGKLTGRDKDPSRILDKPGQYDRNIEWYIPSDVKDPYNECDDRSMDFCWPHKWPGDERRKLRRRRPITDHLIVTPHAEHSARELCESDTSRGPDTVSLVEGLFCDMDTKTLFELCDEGAGIRANCFRLESHILVLANGTEIGQDLGAEGHARREEGAFGAAGGAMPKVYASTQYW